MKRPPPPPARCALALAWAACLGAAAPALAQSSPYYVGVAQSFGHESNMLRLSIDEPVPEGYSLSDSVRSTSLLAGMDQRFGRQRAYGNVAVRNNRYSHNSIFDNTSYSAAAGLDWQTANRLSGTVSANASRSLQRFTTEEIGFQSERNLERVESLNATVSVGEVTAYTLELSGGHRQVRNSLQNASVQAREFSQDNVSVGVRWQPHAGLLVGVDVGATQGRYPKFRIAADGTPEADRFKRNDIALRVSMQPSGASSLDARLSSGRTRYDLNQQRNFNGLTGSFSWRWQPTGKLRFNTSYSRDTGQDSYAITLFNLATSTDYSRVTKALRNQLVYDATAKVQVNVSADIYWRSVVRTIDNPFLPLDATGKERTPILSLGVRWTPLRAAMLGCDLSRERRHASGPFTGDLRSNSYSCYVQATLQ